MSVGNTHINEFKQCIYMSAGSESVNFDSIFKQSVVYHQCNHNQDTKYLDHISLEVTP